MDLIFLEEFVASSEFADIFLKHIDLCGAKAVSIEHSKTDPEYGESDLTIIVDKCGVKHALLIEDKIDAIAMPDQAERYFKRGELGVKNGEYNSFDVFIVAPEKYLRENREAQKYPHHISYEEIALYFKDQENCRAQFKYQMVVQAVKKQKSGHQLIESEEATAFWDAYIDYQKDKYPSLWLTSTKGPRSITSTWTWYRTVIKDVLIYHKCEKGFMDLTFPNQSERIVAFEKELFNILGNVNDLGVFLVKTGKSVALRIEVPVIDIKKSFNEHIDEIEVCFKAANKLSELAKAISEKI